jgi:hypothetical protein
MTNRYRVSVGLIASVLAMGLFLPASATELPVPPIHKVAGVAAPGKKPAQHGIIRIASVEWPPGSENRPHWPFPLVLGVSY